LWTINFIEIIENGIIECEEHISAVPETEDWRAFNFQLNFMYRTYTEFRSVLMTQQSQVDGIRACFYLFRFLRYSFRPARNTALAKDLLTTLNLSPLEAGADLPDGTIPPVQTSRERERPDRLKKLIFQVQDDGTIVCLKDEVKHTWPPSPPKETVSEAAIPAEHRATDTIPSKAESSE